MAYQIVKTLKCITNKELDNKGIVELTVGNIYDSAYSNSTIDSDVFGVYNDSGLLTEFNKKYFKVYETNTRVDNGWEITCNDCFKTSSIKDLIKNNYKCPKCGQKFQII